MNGGTRNGNGGKFDDDADEGTEMTEIVERRKLSNGEFDVDVVVNVVENFASSALSGHFYSPCFHPKITTVHARERAFTSSYTPRGGHHE